jgi:iron transport multicopper oxidase
MITSPLVLRANNKLSAADWWHNKTINMLKLYDESDSTGTHFIPCETASLKHPRVVLIFFFYSVSDSGLFNGRGVSESFSGTHRRLFIDLQRFNGGPLTPYAVSQVTKGKRYRFRIINASARSDFTISVDNREHCLSCSR